MTPATARRQWLAAALLALAAPAWAASPSGQDARAVRQVVEAQLKAMAEGDAERAFSYAAPAIRTQFGDAQRFMAMVAGSYPMVIRPAATVFFQPSLDGDGDVLQVVQLRDAAGKFWRASYLLARQADGQWRIAGCVVAPESSASTT
jgi:ketosteroid isomerase-like protein